jgi:pimeloyl-ACP methyl ester carboxylesterase
MIVNIDALDHIKIDFSSQIRQSLTKNLRRVLLKLEQCGHSPHRDQTAQVSKAAQNFLRPWP